MTRNALLILAKLVLVTAAVAQPDHVLLYGTFSPLHVFNGTTGTATTGFLSSRDLTGGISAYGVGGGVTWNFLHTDAITLGLDLRGSTQPGTPGADTAMLGLRIAGRPFDSPIHPYGQISFGYIGTRARNTSPAIGSSGGLAGGSFGTQYAVLEVLGGVDCTLRPRLDLRVVEFGVGKGEEFALFVTDPSAPVFVTLSTGIVFRF